MSKQLHFSLSTGNENIETHLEALQTAVNRAKGKGFWGALSKAYGNIKGKNFKGRSKLKKDLKSIAKTIADEAAETADLIDKLVKLA